MKIHAQKINGKLEYKKERVEKFIEALKEGEGVQISFLLSKDIRRLEMNNLYWFWLGIISNDVGYTKKELHAYFKEELLCEESEVNGRLVHNCPSTSDMSIKDFSSYLQEVSRLAVQNFNVVLPQSL